MAASGALAWFNAIQEGRHAQKDLYVYALAAVIDMAGDEDRSDWN